jgi:hypothetical protein
MNSSVPEEFIARELEKDHPRAAAEYLAEFRGDIESFVSIEVLRACISPGVRERLPVRQWRYHAFVDPSGGSNDSMTLAICHKEGVTCVLDAIREVRPPFSPEAVVEDFGKLIRSYRITTVHGDRYGGEWCREPFRRHGVNYELSELSKSELYQATLPLLNSGAVDLLDNDRLVHQLVGLERRTARGGKDSIDHARGAHDDLANAAAGAIELAASKPTSWRRERIQEPAVVTLKPRVVADGSERGANWMARR